MPKSPVSQIDVNLTAVQHNVALLRQIVGSECGLCPIVKADAYGLGVVRVARQLVASGADMLAVYTPREAAEILGSAVGGDILILMPVRDIPRADEIYRGLVCGRLHLAAHDEEHIDDLLAIADRYALGLPLHLEVDTGMSRGGCRVEDVPRLLERIHSARRLMLAGIFTHFACAECDEEFTRRQMDVFDHLLTEHAQLIPPGCRVHAANTFATLRASHYHKSMCRVGLAWAGYGPEWMRGSQVIESGWDLEPCVTWSSRLVQVKRIPKGSPVGYGGRWTAGRESVIGLVPVGYADGYPIALGCDDASAARGWLRLLPAHGEGAVDVFVPVVGAVNMDQITVDLTDAAGPSSDSSRVRVDARVELITPDAAAPNHLPTLAREAGTIPHEMLCRLNPRVARCYTVSVAAPAMLETAAVG